MTEINQKGNLSSRAVGAAAVGGGVALGCLLLLLRSLAQRIAEEASGIHDSLADARSNTDPLFELSRLNATLERMNRDLRAVREELET